VSGLFASESSYREKNMRKILVISIGALSVFVLISFSALFFIIKSRLPEIDGEMSLKGLTAAVTILTDKWGIPHIRAENKEDLYFGLGYVHARDRLFQMEFLKRIALGRFSEITGESGLRYDKMLRTLQFKSLAEQVSKALGPEEKRLGLRYIDGINSYLTKHKNKYPIEFDLMGFAPEEWSEIDLLTYAHLAMWRMSYNYKSEMLYHKIQKKTGHDMAIGLLPYRPEGVPSLISGFSAKTILTTRLPDCIDFLGIFSPPGGSNNWVLSGEKTISGKPIFVEDPHDPGPSVPSTFYIAHLVCPDWDIIGISMPGLPFFQHGYNKFVAYGSTTMGSDVQDFFLEKINPNNPEEYLFKGNWHQVRTYQETIRVRDKDYPGGYRKEGLTIRCTNHGPILPDIMAKEDKAMSIKWFAFDARVIGAMKRMSESKNCGEFLDAGKDYMSGSAQNFLCADIKGNIAYACLGWFPVRRQGTVSWFPKPGWTGEYDWQGGISSTALPSLLNPAKGYLASANNQVLASGHQPNLDGKYSPHYRYSRIVELLEAKEKFSLEDTKKMLADKKSLLAQKLVPLLMDVLNKSDHPDAREAVKYLGNWDFQMRPDSVSATLYHQIILEFLMLTLSDQLGDRLALKYLNQWNLSLDRWVFFLERDMEKWFDDIKTPEKEGREDVINKAFQQAIFKLNKILGKKMKDWQWGEVHKLEFRHRPMGKGGWLMRKLFNLGQYAYGGDMETINRGSYNVMRPFEINTVSSFRFVIDFSQPDKAFIVQSSGQSEHLLSPYRDNHVKTFLNGELIAVDLDLKKVEKEADGKFVLMPKDP
jgi:penicillin amidase